MKELLALSWGTVALRPYVLAFLVAHLWSAGGALGARRAATLTGTVWAVAFAAEWTSTRVGFPFGPYVYTQATWGQELFISNVPFMDSLSFTFLAWASYALALTLIRVRGAGAGREDVLSLGRRTAPGTLALAVGCLVLIDVIIDPLAVRGDRWFLGKIFEYPRAGAYFGVPLSNFGGWAVVGALGFGLYAALDRRWEARGRSLPARAAGTLRWGAALWFGVAAFNLLITFAIGEVPLGLAGLTIVGTLVVLLAAGGAVPLPGRAARAYPREIFGP